MGNGEWVVGSGNGQERVGASEWDVRSGAQITYTLR